MIPLPPMSSPTPITGILFVEAWVLLFLGEFGMQNHTFQHSDCPFSQLGIFPFFLPSPCPSLSPSAYLDRIQGCSFCLFLYFSCQVSLSQCLDSNSLPLRKKLLMEIFSVRISYDICLSSVTCEFHKSL